MSQFLEQDSAAPVHRETTLERDGHVARLRAPEGTYTIIYGNHCTATNPADLPEELDGVILETGGNDWTRKPWLLSAFRHDRQYGILLRSLEARKIPVYFADVRTDNIHFAIETVTIGTEATMGTLLLHGASATAYAAYRRQKMLTRRAALKLGAQAAIGSWLTLPPLSVLSILGSHFLQTGEGVAATVQKCGEALHPEIYPLMLHMRNAVIAHKERWLMDRMGNRPHFATVMGGMHVGIEEDIRREPDDRLQFLTRMRPLFASLSAKDMLPKIARWDFDGMQWKCTAREEVPELKQLVG